MKVARSAPPPARGLGLRQDKLDALLDAAAAELNAYGISGASLSRIARAVGLTRAALYYYVRSREDLALRCYLRTCRRTADDLAAAAAVRSGLERLQRFIGRVLDPARAPSVVLSEIHALGAAGRAEVERAHGRNVAALQGFIAEGIADGSLRDCDTEIAAQALIGMLSWVPLAEEWAAGSGEAVRRHAARTVAELVSHGVAADPQYPFACPLEISALGFQPGNAFDREAAAAMKIELLTRSASRLFNRRGIDGVSLDQITQELGATKGAFYQYMPDKTALVIECYRRAQQLFMRIADSAGKLGRNGLERGLIGLHLLVQAHASELSPLASLTGLEALPARSRNAIRRRGQELERLYERFSLEGIRDGSYRPFDARTLSTLGAGAFSWIPKWRRDDDPRPPRVVADEIVALFVRGLGKRR